MVRGGGRGGVVVVSCVCVCVSRDGGRSKELRFCVNEVVVNIKCGELQKVN